MGDMVITWYAWLSGLTQGPILGLIGATSPCQLTTNLRKFLEEFNVTYPAGWTPAARSRSTTACGGLPATFIIDRKGQMTYKHVGALGAATVMAKLDEALRGIVSTAEGQGEYQSVQR